MRGVSSAFLAYLVRKRPGASGSQILGDRIVLVGMVGAAKCHVHGKTEGLRERSSQHVFCSPPDRGRANHLSRERHAARPLTARRDVHARPDISSENLLDKNWTKMVRFEIMFP